MERFHENYDRLKKEVQKLEIAEDLKVLETDDFVKKWYPIMKEKISHGVLVPEVEIFQGVTCGEVYEKMSSDNKKVFISYIHALFSLSFSHVKDTTKDEDILKVVEDFPEIVANMVEWKRPKVEESEGEKVPDFEGSLIANLAKEISDEIDPNEIKELEKEMENIDNPMKLFKTLLSEEDNKIGKLMGTVCSKLQERMEDGRIDQEKMAKEATNMMKSMGGFEELMKSMGKERNGMEELMKSMGKKKKKRKNKKKL